MNDCKYLTLVNLAVQSLYVCRPYDYNICSAYFFIYLDANQCVISYADYVIKKEDIFLKHRKCI